jgi:hypothetical protein
MRKFSTFAGMMPRALIEAHAKIYNSEEKHCPGDVVDFCRFGYAIRWCDGSGQAYFVEDESIETAIEAAKSYLDSKGWHIGEITYTGAELTDEIIEEHTTKMQSKAEALAEYSRFLQLKIACLARPWFDAVRSEINGAVSVYNIAALPDDLRESSYRKELIGFCNNEHTCVRIGYEIEDDYIKDGEWVVIDDAKRRLGLPDDATDVEVVDKVVAQLVDDYNHRTEKMRRRKETYIARFKALAERFEKALHACAKSPEHSSLELAVLEAYLKIEWTKDLHDVDGILEISSKFETRVDLDTIKLLSINRSYFDWSTLQLETDGELTIGKVKIDPIIYTEVRSCVKELSPNEVGRITEMHREYKAGYVNDWRTTELDTQWWHFKYGIDKDGDATLVSAFGPERKCYE